MLKNKEVITEIDNMFNSQRRTLNTVMDFTSYFGTLLNNYMIEEYEAITREHGSGMDIPEINRVPFMEDKWCMVYHNVMDKITDYVNDYGMK